MTDDYGRLQKSGCARCGMTFRVVDKPPNNDRNSRPVEPERCPEPRCGRTFFSCLPEYREQGIRCYVLHA